MQSWNAYTLWAATCGLGLLLTLAGLGSFLLGHLVYIITITAMMAMAVATFSAHGGLVVLVGAGLFVVSDLTVARNRFVAPGFVNRAWGLPMYFSAQLLLAASVALI